MVAEQSLLAHVGLLTTKVKGTETSVDRDMLLMPAVLEKCMLMYGFLVFDNWVAGPYQTDLVNVLYSD